MGLSYICLFTMLIQLVFSFIFFNFTIGNFTTSSMLPLCHDDERSALLQFKESAINGDFDDWKFECRPTLVSWKPEEGNTDCCSWDGVHCNKNTGHVIKLDLSNSCLFGSINSSSSLFKLVHLEWLNLAFNNFNSSEIPPEIINLSRLSYLNLSGSFLSGQIPSEILELFNLVSLDLSLNDDNLGRLELQKPNLANLIEKLSNLKKLDLRDVSIRSTMPHNLENLSSLTFLSLRNCELQGRIISSLANLSKLRHLDLSLNELEGELPISIGNLCSLKELYLSANFLSSELPISIGNLSTLKELDLSQNRLSGKLPISIGNLGSLKELDLSQNTLSGELPTSIQNLFSLENLDLSMNQLSGEFLWSTRNFSSLKILDLTSCSFWGKVRHSIGNFTRLQFLSLAYNNFSGDLLASIGNLRLLEVLAIIKCNFSGRIPSSLRNLTQLIVLDISQNSYSGTTELDFLLTSLKNLEVLALSSNRLSLLTKATSNTTSQKFRYIGMRSCDLTEFPKFLKSQRHLIIVDLSSNRIHGKVPKWLLDPSMQNLNALNFSYNFLTGFDQHPVVIPGGGENYLFTLDLSSNNLQGPLPIPPPETIHYLASKSSLTGEIPSWICSLNRLESLVLSHNNLSGLLPQCLGYFSDELQVLDLQGNNFFGTIPNTFIKESRLGVIDLSHNLFQGRIPRSLINCSKLEFLDLGNNQISDTFPSWLGTLPNLNVLILQSNTLYGVIREPRTDCGFSKLRILDLSNNRFTGKLPSKSFLCWNAMKIVNTSELRYLQDVISPYGQVSYQISTYDYSLTMKNKGRMMTYGKIPDILTGVILSSNRFDGEIPTSIANLKGLQVLSVADNSLQGHLPSCLGNLTNVESLDLSNNRFSGQIPQQLVGLTFLAFFNVSHNNLTGPIPQGNQFSTFDNSSFDGNSGLCGRPLSKECENSEATTNNDHHIDGSEESLFSGASDWKIILIGYAGGLVVGLVLGFNFSTGIVGWFLEKLGMQQKATGRKMRRRN